MLAIAMIPESYEHAGKPAGLFTVVGFFVAVAMIAAEAGHVAMGGVVMSRIATGSIAMGSIAMGSIAMGSAGAG